MSSKTFGLIGFPLSHSFSSKYFREKFSAEKINGCSYENFPIASIKEFPVLLENNPLLYGLNVTIPYKEAVIPYLDELSAEAQEIGAVNTIKIERSTNAIKTTGYNTDVYGFEQSLLVNKVPNPGKAMILGTGGASKAVEWVLKKMKCDIFFVSRTPQTHAHLSWDQISGPLLQTMDLVVNTTPLGMFPQIEQYPLLPYDWARKETTFFDLIYNPATTLFLQKAAENGCPIVNGLFMLEQQAEKSWNLWNTD
jgi:shikimate dehydrogenase